MRFKRIWRKFNCGLVVATLAALASSSRAQEWTVTTADFSTVPALFKALGPDGMRIASPDTKAETVLPLNQFVSLQRPAVDEGVQPAEFTLLLNGGDRLVGTPGPVIQEQLSWVSPTLGSITIPFSKLVCITRGPSAATPEGTAKQDQVTLVNGDTLAGVFTDCKDQKVTVQVDSGPTSVALDSVKRIVFAATGSTKISDLIRAYKIRLSDSSIITASDASSDGTVLKLTLQEKKAQSVGVPISKVIGIEQLNGPVGWLSSMIPTESIQVPYLGGSATWPARFDLSVDGTPLTFGGRIFNHGIGVHAYSKLTFAIDPQWTVFRTQFAISSHRDEPRKFADVNVRLLLDGKLVKEETHFREGVMSPVIMIDLKGAKTISLECDYGSAADTQAHLDWIEAALLHNRPVSPTPASDAPTSAPTTQP